jgi:hypothetical protein
MEKILFLFRNIPSASSLHSGIWYSDRTVSGFPGLYPLDVTRHFPQAWPTRLSPDTAQSLQETQSPTLENQWLKEFSPARKETMSQML